MPSQQNRREFLGHLSVASAAMVGAPSFTLPHADGTEPANVETWDMSWLEALKSASYRAVIDASTFEDGYAPNLASGLIEHHKQAHPGTRDDQVRIVIVARRGGTPLVMNDALWQRFPLGEATKQNDGATNAPVRRNPFYKARAGASPEAAASTMENLKARGTIFLVCNIALNNWVRSLAETTKRDVEDVTKEVFANLVPGAIVQPSGVFALMRAQNAGCAYMRGA